jgi:hypothetical protein
LRVCPARVHTERQNRLDIIPPERAADFRGTGKIAACSGRSLITRKLVRMHWSPASDFSYGY